MVDNVAMARPSKPLIRRDAVVEASLRIIDTEGLDALSLPRLARELNVQAPSLYHHFEDKAEILKAVARAIVVETRLPDPKSVPNWIEWLVALSLAFRESMLRHHNAVPLLLQFMPRDVLIRNYNASALYLTEIGVPLEQVVLILDGLDKLTLGAGITEAMHRDDGSGRPFQRQSSDRACPGRGGGCQSAIRYRGVCRSHPQLPARCGAGCVGDGAAPAALGGLWFGSR